MAPSRELHRARYTFAFLLCFFLLLAFMPRAVGAQEEWQRAGLVVTLADGRTETRCVAFSEPSLSGYELLLRSGLEVAASVAPMGAMVCTIEATGCPPSDCLCQCRGGGSCVYWSYWRLEEGEWRYGRAGASSSQVRDGAVEGWAWGLGTVSSASPPPLYTFEEICQAATGAGPIETVPVAAIGEAPVSHEENRPAGSYLVFGLIITGLAIGWLALRHRQQQFLEE
jgi:hypothetical protein